MPRRAWLAAVVHVDAARDPADLAALAAAFDAWWLTEHPPGAPIADDARSWWHGCWLEAGHYLFTRNGRHAYGSPLDRFCLDGGFAPRRRLGSGLIVRAGLVPEDRRSALMNKSEELPQGQFARGVVSLDDGPYTIISWWDRTQGDTRSNCSSCFIVAGDHTSEAMLAAFPRHFPVQAARLEKASIQLVEVDASRRA